MVQGVCVACQAASVEVEALTEQLLWKHNDAILRAQGVLCAFAANRARVHTAADLADTGKALKELDVIEELVLELRALKTDVQTGAFP